MATTTFKPAIASMSLGRAWVHKLPIKLAQASSAGFKGLEVFYEDIEYIAKDLAAAEQLSNGVTATTSSSASLSSSTPKPQITDAHLLAATKIFKSLADENGLEIIGLQPFMHYEGLLDRSEHAARIKKLHFWFQLAKILGTDTIQIPSNFLPASDITEDFTTIVEDLLEVAELGAGESPSIRFAYENLCWGTHVDTWEAAWKIVEAVDRPNFGLCLDTFNIAGREWADPSLPSGVLPNADKLLTASLEKMVKTIDVKKVFYVQVVDAERMRNPLVPGHVFHVDGQPARMSWSRNARLFAFESGGYLPVVQVLRAITEGLEYKGWISMELFSRTMADPDSGVPAKHAGRGMSSWRKLVEEMGW